MPPRPDATRTRPAFHSDQPFELARIHAAAIYCSDGRFGEQIDQFLHQGLGLPRYDRLATPGGPACLAGHPTAWRQEQGLIEDLRFLVGVHGLERVVLIAHHNCAFYLQHLRVEATELLARQCADLDRAAQQIARLDSSLKIEPYLALLEGDTVVFQGLEAVRLRLTQPMQETENR